VRGLALTRGAIGMGLSRRAREAAVAAVLAGPADRGRVVTVAAARGCEGLAVHAMGEGSAGWAWAAAGLAATGALSPGEVGG
jgi:hypothetical protein